MSNSDTFRRIDTIVIDIQITGICIGFHSIDSLSEVSCSYLITAFIIQSHTGSGTVCDTDARINRRAINHNSFRYITGNSPLEIYAITIIAGFDLPYSVNIVSLTGNQFFFFINAVNVSVKRTFYNHNRRSTYTGLIMSVVISIDYKVGFCKSSYPLNTGFIGIRLSVNLDIVPSNVAILLKFQIPPSRVAGIVHTFSGDPFAVNSVTRSGSNERTGNTVDPDIAAEIITCSTVTVFRVVDSGTVKLAIDNHIVIRKVKGCSDNKSGYISILQLNSISCSTAKIDAFSGAAVYRNYGIYFTSNHILAVSEGGVAIAGEQISQISDSTAHIAGNSNIFVTGNSICIFPLNINSVIGATTLGNGVNSTITGSNRIGITKNQVV